MMNRLKKLAILFFILSTNFLCSFEEISCQQAENRQFQLFEDLETVKKVNKKTEDEIPITYNYMMMAGYFNMPSARIPTTGDFCLGFSFLPPYRVYSASFPYFEHVELALNYWVFHGMIEQNFGNRGYGDDADRAADIKVVLLRKQDGIPELPEFAVGINDFMGSQRFRSFYFVATKTLPQYNFEVSLGWGTGRIRGLFGGFSWFPFRQLENFMSSLALTAEYDANNYKHHSSEHINGRTVKSPINVGIHYRLLNMGQLSLSSVRGEKVAFLGALHYDFGHTEGFMPKIKNPPFYRGPINREPIGDLRSEKEFVQELSYAFQKQGFEVYKARLYQGEKERFLRVNMVNIIYRNEDQVRDRIAQVLSALTPQNLEKVIVVLENEGVATLEYNFHVKDLQKYIAGQMGSYELDIVSPAKNVKFQDQRSYALYERRKKIWQLTGRPQFTSFFGSSSGKFKYDLGIVLDLCGYLRDFFYYEALAGYSISASTNNVGDHDCANPSRLLNVRTDYVRYYQASSFHMQKLYIQNSSYLGKGWFLRLGAGYFESAYAGLVAETMFYPIDSDWAVGLEFSSLLKRAYYGMGFQHNVRRFLPDGNHYEYVHFVGIQYFLDTYYRFRPLGCDFRVSLGQFLAKDKGARFEISRYFPSGLRMYLWYTITNGNDHVNNHLYYDKGVGFSLPLDVFLPKSSRTRVGYAMSAWLRDVGARAETGKTLYSILFPERE